MKKYCCKKLNDLEDDPFQRSFGVNVIEKDKVEIFCVDDDGYPNRIDEYTFNFCSFCGSKLAGPIETS
jgi:hypothetical protein